MTAPFSEADVKLVADAAEGAPWPCEHSNPKSTDPGDWWTCPQCQATAALAALAAAGRLLPPGTDTVEQWGTRVTRDGVSVGDPEVPTTRERAQARVDFHARKRAEEPGWRGAAELVHRYQHTTPYTSVDRSSGNSVGGETP